MYGLCRKYQDDASALISACDQSPTGLTSKLKSLVDNQNAVNDAQAAIQNKVKNGIPNIKQQQPAQETSCQLAIRLIEQMIDTLKQNPASQQVAQLAKEAADAAIKAICNAADISSLQMLDADISDTEGAISEELDNVQNFLEGKS
jgi:N-methylhydantoinase B/oxoprolinase/acetone carboxylase alpha subunit